MTDETTEPTEILPGPDPTVSLPSADPGASPAPVPPPGSTSPPTDPPGEPGPWVAGPPPPPPGQDPGVPVRDAPPAPRRGRAPSRRRWAVDVRRLGGEPVWLLAVGGILVAYAAVWLASILDALRHQPGLTAQGRLLELFGPGTLEWAALILLGVAIFSGARRVLGPARHPLFEPAGTGLFVAAAGVAGAAGLGILVELANFGYGVDAAFIGIVGRLGTLALAGATAWWAWRDRGGTLG